MIARGFTGRKADRLPVSRRTTPGEAGLNIELTIGQQSTAAMTVQESVPTLNRFLQDLSDAIEANASGFSGSAAAGFGDAIGAWFEAAARLGPALEQYATALSVVDQEHAANEGEQVDSYSRLTDRLGGPR